MSMHALEPGEAQAAQDAGMRASDDYHSHYAANIAGQGSCAGDPMPSASAEVPYPVPDEPET